MKPKTLLLLALLALPVLLFGADGLTATNSTVAGEMTADGSNPVVAAPDSRDAWLVVLIPAVVPLLVAAAKKLIVKLPTWVMPILAAALGEAINWVSGLLGGPSVGAVAGVLLGAAGVGVREVLDQVKTRITEGPVTKPPTP